LTWLDNVIGWISPEAGLRRAHMRNALQVARSYEGARHGRRTAGWTAGAGSANSEIGPSLAYLRNRSRQLVRDNPYASRAIDTLVSACVGTGVLAKTGNRQVDQVWERWCKVADADGLQDWYGIQALLARGMFESGEVLLQRTFPTSSAGLDVPMQVRVLEADFLDNTKTERLSDGGFIITGIEHDATGKRVAYWLYDNHPGEVIPIAGFGYKSRRVSADQVIHLYERKRPGQVRGVPRLASSLMRMRDLDDYEEAELVRKKIEACFAAFVTTSEDKRTLAESSQASAKGPRIETFSPGMIEYLAPGESVDFGAPAPSDNSNYVAQQLYAIAAGAGVTYGQLTGDYRRSTFSSERVAIQEFRQMMEALRWLVFVPAVCERVFAWFTNSAYYSGRVRTDSYNVQYTPPKWPWLDPLKDTQAAKEEIKGGLRTLSEHIRMLGYNPDEVFAEMKDERDRLSDLGIKLDTTQPQASQAPAAQPGDDDNSDDEDGGDASTSSSEN